MARTPVVGAIGVALVWAAVAGAAPGDPKKDLKPADQALAASAILPRADLPPGRWTGNPTDFSQPNPPCLVRHYSLARLTATGEAGRTYLRTDGSAMESDAHVFVSTKQAALAYGTLTGLGLARCLGSAFAQSIAKATSTLSATATGKLLNVVPVRLAGVRSAPARGFRIFIRLRSPKGDSLVEIVLVGVHQGRTVGSLSFVRVGEPLAVLKTTALWPDSVVSSLTRKLAARLTSR